MSQLRILDAAGRLRASLDAVACALAVPDVAALTVAEASLASALADLSGIRVVDPEERATLLVEIRCARSALARCRILGAAAADAARASLSAQGLDANYDRAGISPMHGAYIGSAVKARL